MVWSPLLTILLMTLFGAGVLIFCIENWSRVEPIFARWGWLFEVPMALLFGYSALESWIGGDAVGAAIGLLLASMLAWSAAARIRRLHQSRVE